jgi:murein DD-endopeptidase MepM/ murein hydrolase activator NlpD
MNKRKILSLFLPAQKFISAFPEFLNAFSHYLKEKVVTSSTIFETYKNILVRFFMIKRGRYSRPFLHLATMGVLTIGVLIAPFLASTYPVFSQNSSTSAKITSPSNTSMSVGEDVFGTQISQKPRDKTIEYTVQKGDTVSTIAQKFGISADTVRWANDLANDNIAVGDTLEILPVTGISYKVQSGDTVYTIAKKYATDPQKIVDFPFNDFANPEKFTLVTGQMLIVPDGIKPSEQPYFRPQVYIAQGPTSFSSAGFTWPVHGIVSQFASWYHMALDISGPYGTPIVAAKSGVVFEVNTGSWNYGYGNDVVVDNGGGYSTLYAHMEAVNVRPGQEVIGGSTVLGWIGMTGRTTGPHVHFEVRQNGTPVNPLPFLQ